jgi:hypothetical protein
VILAEVQLPDITRLQFGDVEHGLLIALLALHGRLPHKVTAIIAAPLRAVASTGAAGPR